MLGLFAMILVGIGVALAAFILSQLFHAKGKLVFFFSCYVVWALVFAGVQVARIFTGGCAGIECAEGKNFIPLGKDYFKESDNGYHK